MELLRIGKRADGNRATAEGKEIIKENLLAVMNAGDKIVKGVELPSLGEDEYKPVDPSESVDD